MKSTTLPEQQSALSFDPDQAQSLVHAIEQDIETGLYYGASLKIAHRGDTVVDLAVGHGDNQKLQPIQQDSVFSIFSITKSFVNVLVLRWIELGRFALTTKVAELIPEFTGAPRNRATVFHLLTHTAGMPGVWEPIPGMFPDVLAENVAAVVDHVHGVVEPGSRCDYAPMVNHTLLAEALVRSDPQGRSIGQILDEELFRPLGMHDSALGIRPHMRSRHVFPDMRGTVPIKSRSRSADGDYGLYDAESNECTWAGGASSTKDLLRFAEMLRGGGSLGDTRILSPVTVRAARRIWTGDMPNELYKTVALRAEYEVPPAYIGLGFNVRGDRMVNTQLGTLTSPETFGNYGAGSALYWVDPVQDLTFVCLTAGLLPQAANIARFQRLSDMAVTSLRH